MMKRWPLFFLVLLSASCVLLACTFREPDETRATVVTSPATVVDSFLSRPTPTAYPLPTRSVDVVVITRTVEAEPPAENASPLGVPDDLEPAGDSEHFTFFVEPGARALPMEELGPLAEDGFDYVSARLGATFDGSIDVIFRPPPGTACPPRGMALGYPPEELQDAPLIYIFAGRDTDRDQIAGVLAHEVAHILHARALEQGLSRSSALNEGFAHWLSADYVYAWYDTPSYDALVRGYLDAGIYLPLREHYELRSIYPDSEDSGLDDDACLRRRDQLYSQWASFVGFLIETYGMERFLALMDSPEAAAADDARVIHPPDYRGVYGLALNQLEVVWLRRLLGDRG